MSDVLTVAEKDKKAQKPVAGKNEDGTPASARGSARAPTGAGPDEKPAYTTLRFYEADGEDLSDFADAEGLTIAEAYRRHCAAMIRALLIRRTEERLKRLKDQAE